MSAPHADSPPRTLYDKLWDAHVVADLGDGHALLWIDRQLLHEVSSPQGFEGLRTRGIGVASPASNLAVADHAVPTRNRHLPIADANARAQVALLESNALASGIDILTLGDARQGIVHVVGPEQGFTQPGLTIVCGDSHTATHGAFGALAFGIGSSDCECVLATRTLKQRKATNTRLQVDGDLPEGVSAKDLALHVVATLGAGGAVGSAIEYTGDAVRALTMAGRMTLCNMSIEAGARIGLIAPDETTYAWLAGRPRVPRGAMGDLALAHWRTLFSDVDATFDRVVRIDAAGLRPMVTWGTRPDQVAPLEGHVPDPAHAANAALSQQMSQALAYMGLTAGAALASVRIDHVFIGSCTNGRIEDLRAAAAVLRGRRKAEGVTAIVVPGSGLVKAQAEREGLHDVFIGAGFEWRDAGCSLCVAMNDDRLEAGMRCASTSNRNFEGRQGPGARTHLMSPASAAASALAGHLAWAVAQPVEPEATS